MYELKTGFSPCPNDTFMFEGLVNGDILSTDWSLQCTIADVQELNELTAADKLDVSKISFGAYPAISDRYELLRTGAALGFGVGPLLISKRIDSAFKQKLSTTAVAIPGEQTTAALLLKLFFPEFKNTVSTLFSEIEEAVLSEKVGAGVIIHENRFTYRDKGLKLLADLGELWEEKMEMALPLGGIAIRRDLPAAIKLQFEQALKKSIELAFERPDDRMPYVVKYASEMDPEVMKKHIDLYVSDESIWLSKEARKAVITLLKQSGMEGKKKFTEDLIFLQS